MPWERTAERAVAPPRVDVSQHSMPVAPQHAIGQPGTRWRPPYTQPQTVLYTQQQQQVPAQQVPAQQQQQQQQQQQHAPPPRPGGGGPPPMPSAGSLQSPPAWGAAEQYRPQRLPAADDQVCTARMDLTRVFSGEDPSKRACKCSLRTNLHTTKEMMHPCLIYLHAISLTPCSSIVHPCTASAPSPALTGDTNGGCSSCPDRSGALVGRPAGQQPDRAGRRGGRARAEPSLTDAGRRGRRCAR